MRLLGLLALLAAFVLPVRAGTIDLTQSTMAADDFNPVSLVKTANRLIALGQKDAGASLLQYAEAYPIKSFDAEIVGQREVRDQHLAWLCLLLYDPKPGEGLPPPLFGAPAFPILERGSSTISFPPNPAAWSRFPLAVSRNVPFLLVSGYTLGGRAEAGIQYLSRIQAVGTFHATPYPVPTHTEVQQALDDLIASAPWKALKWDRENKDREVLFLRAQVARIK